MEKTLASCIRGDHTLSDDDRFNIACLLTERCSLRTKWCVLSVLTYGLSQIPAYGLLERVYFDEKSNTWCYCAGQSSPDEIRTIRNIFNK